jgi:two-component system sensor histidine kinase UhpB
MIGTDTDITERRLAETRLRDNETALRKSYEDNKDLVGRLITAQEAERTRIARDLHDDVSQELAGLSIALSSLKRRLIGTGQTEDIEDTLTTVQQRTIALADNIRGLSHDLHPGILQHVGLAAALQAHCAELGRHQPFKLQMKADGDLGPIDPLIALCLYRVAQEGLANATRHARPQSVQVRLHRTVEGYELSIVDDGCGFDPAGGNGNTLGLRSMDERVRFLGGTLGVESHPGHGTKLLARIPLIDRA